MPRVTHASWIGLVLIAWPCAALAVNPAHWMIVEEVTRTDMKKIWTSPTAIDLGKMVWEYDYEVTKLTGTVNVPIVGDVTEDITSLLPADFRMGSGETRELPAVLLDQMIVEPETGTSADVLVEIDHLGFGQAVFSKVMLGSADVPLFGSLPIQRINIEASVDIIGYDFGDYDRRGAVDAADYVMWRNAFGQTGLDLAADGNGDEQIDGGDYEVWRTNFGRGAGVAIASAVPEPATGKMFLIAVLVTGFRRARRDLSRSGF